jgi:hypothetical protein
MKIIEVTALSNGAHRNQIGNITTIPSGWAVIPDGMITENFPFGEVTTAVINGVTTVTKWIPGKKPELKPEKSKELTYIERIARLESAIEVLVKKGIITEEEYQQIISK